MDEDNEALAPRFPIDPAYLPIDPETLAKVFQEATERAMVRREGILDSGHNVIRPQSLLQWAQFMEVEETRRVAATHLNGFWISTVFLGIDHGFGGSSLWFETMIFGDDNIETFRRDIGDKIAHHLVDQQWRYETWDEAVQGHKAVVEMIQYGLF